MGASETVKGYFKKVLNKPLHTNDNQAVGKNATKTSTVTKNLL